MLKIRLSRTGKKKQPSYRVVVADINARRDGRVVERIGYYNPLADPIEYRIKEERALYWLSVGAKPTDAVERLLVKQGTIERLNRLRAGEPLAALLAEFNGETAVEEEPAISEAAPEEEPAVAGDGEAVEASEDPVAEADAVVESGDEEDAVTGTAEEEAAAGETES